MKTKEIKRESWVAFCDQATRLLPSATVHVVFTDLKGSSEVWVETGALERIQFVARTGECNDQIVLRAGQGREHVIIDPIHLRLKNGANDRYNRLHILAEQGTAILEFNPGLLPNSLENLEPG